MEQEGLERRLAAVLAADVVGYARLMRQDEVATFERLRALRKEVVQPTIAARKGRIVKLMGDGMLAVFPSVVEAVQSAMDIQRALDAFEAETPDDKRIRLRIGINLGDIMIAGSDIYGDGVNIAARLEALATPGGLCISSIAYQSVGRQLAEHFADAGEHQVKNIDQPIRVYRWPAEQPKSAGTSAPALVLPDKPSIAVLPFQNMSGDAEQEYFTDGMVEDIITALSRLPWLFVIARNSSFTYKGKAVDIKTVGRELGVRYVLEGSVRKAGNRVRVTGQLIDATTGTHIWANRYDGELEDIFDLQDQLTSTVVGAIAPELEKAEINRIRQKPTESLGAYDHYLRGMAAFHQFDRDANREALAHFEKAIELDPKYAAAYGMAARCYLQRKGFGWVTDREHETAEATRLAHLAIELGRDDAIALCAAGATLLVVVGDLDGASAAIDRSLGLNPNLAWLWHFSALAKAFLGEPDIAVAHAERSIRLSPHDPQMMGMQAAAAFGHLFAGRHDDALSWAQSAIQGQSNFFVAYTVAAASAALVGNQVKAEAAMAKLRQLNPELRLSNLKDLLPIRRKQDFDCWAEGLRKAGLPE